MPNFTGINRIDALLAPDAKYFVLGADQAGLSRWHNGNGNPTVVTYGFMTSLPGGYNDLNQFLGKITGLFSGLKSFKKFNANQIQAAHQILNIYERYIDVEFDSQGFNDGDLYFGTADFDASGTAAQAIPPGYDFGLVNLSGDVWLNREDSSNLNPSQPGSVGFGTLLHEIGHALGLKHPGEYNAGTQMAIVKPFLPDSKDNNQYTVMSYNDHPGVDADPSTPLLYDIGALQYLYGPNTTYHKGNSVYSWTASKAFLEAIWDTGGTDEIDASNQTLRVIINLGAAKFSSIGPKANNSNTPATNNLAIAYGVTLENATGGAGDDTLYGNSVNNTLIGTFGEDDLYGYDGNDSLGGGADHDNLFGGEGNDSLGGGTGNDYLAGGDGRDTLSGGSGNDTLTATKTIANTTTTGNDSLLGGLGNDTLLGSAGDNKLFGEEGNDFLKGFGGNDSLDGGAGLDTLYGGTGVDSLGGGSGDDTLYGDEGSDRLSGGTDDDQLNGGSGGDTLWGGAAHDTLNGGDGGDILNGENGNDSLNGSTGDDGLDGGSGNDSLNGGSDDDELWGGIGLDTLLGSTGNDTLVGGGGNDRLTGGSGEDEFYFETSFLLHVNGVDTITDFTVGVDKIVLSADIFTNVPLPIAPGNPPTGTSWFAVVRDDRSAASSAALIVYNEVSGDLFYNQNGVDTDLGTGGRFATLSNLPTLSTSDFTMDETLIIGPSP